MRAQRLMVLLVSFAGFVGCANVLGLDFSSYREGQDKDAGRPAQASGSCIPNATLRCLCELREGTQTCDESGKLTPCVCSEAGTLDPCGDGVLDPPEACDDLNRDDGDGCSSVCMPDGRPASVEACPGQIVNVWPGQGILFELAGSVRAAPADAGTCGASPQPDRILQLVSLTSGKLEVAVTPSRPVRFSLRTICGDAGPALSCDLAAAAETTKRTIDVLSTEPVFLILEPRESSADATYTIQVTAL